MIKINYAEYIANHISSIKCIFNHELYRYKYEIMLCTDFIGGKLIDIKIQLEFISIFVNSKIKLKINIHHLEIVI